MLVVDCLGRPAAQTSEGARGKHQPKDARSPASLGTWECESFDASHVAVHSSAAR